MKWVNTARLLPLISAETTFEPQKTRDNEDKEDNISFSSSTCQHSRTAAFTNHGHMQRPPFCYVLTVWLQITRDPKFTESNWWIAANLLLKSLTDTFQFHLPLRWHQLEWWWWWCCSSRILENGGSLCPSASFGTSRLWRRHAMRRIQRAHCHCNWTAENSNKDNYAQQTTLSKLLHILTNSMLMCYLAYVIYYIWNHG